MNTRLILIFMIFAVCPIPLVDARSLLLPKLHQSKSNDGNRINTATVAKLSLLRAGSGIDIPVKRIHPIEPFVLQTLLTLFNIICWAAPLQIKTFRCNKTLLSLANSFAGGVFLMLAFGHIIPEAVGLLSNSNNSTGCQTILLYVLTGFMSMLFIDKIAFISDVSHPNVAVSDVPTASTFSGSKTVDLNPDEELHHIKDWRGEQQSVDTAKARSAISLCCAMSMHSLFESAALGLAVDKASLYMMSACIAMHQPAESLSLLVSFLKSRMNNTHLVAYLTTFSLMSPVGLVLGLCLKKSAPVSWQAFVMALTSGTFIYVGATEIANEEFGEEVTKKNKLYRFITFSLGVILMGVLSMLGT